jgi:hypothetical protein
MSGQTKLNLINLFEKVEHAILLEKNIITCEKRVYTPTSEKRVYTPKSEKQVRLIKK